MVVSCSLILKSLLANPRYLTEIHRPPHEFEKLVSVPEPISLFPDTEKLSRLARLTCTRSVVSTEIRDIKMSRTVGDVVLRIGSNEYPKDFKILLDSKGATLSGAASHCRKVAS